MKQLLFFLLIFFSFCSSSVKAQENEDLENAVKAYDLGHFEQADSMLLMVVNKSKGEKLVQAYRLLALSSLNQDRETEAEAYVGKLLSVDPYYTAYNDSPRFIDIVERLKKGQTTVSTASRMNESIEEVPVPITLITEEMIRASGANSLNDVLALYVPGMSQIGSLEQNIAMRGVYGLAQETVLVMIDGHRLNSVTTNAVAFDYRHDLNKIKQIEVLRGPASSLYGNVALTAVVNIITKSGSDIDGGRLNARAGSFDTYGGAAMFGKGNLMTDVVAWGSIYSAKGEKHNLNRITHYVGGYNSQPSYEFGGKIRWGNFKASLIAQYSKTVPYYNLIGLDDRFTYDAYHEQGGEKPGFSQSLVRTDLEYNKTWGDFSFSASAFMSKERIQIYNVLGDTVDYMIAAYLANALGIQSVKTRGVVQLIGWEDYSFGANANGACNYRLGSNMYGSMVFGVQYETFVFSNAELKLGADFSQINNTLNTIFNESSEHTLSSFFQLKHNFSKRFIFNSGIRFDHKIRQDERRINTWSPRVSLIWLANDILSFKGGYSHSFVDAPLFYRGSYISIFSGGENLDSEKMDAFQVSANFNWKKLHLTYEINAFYNKVKGLVYYNQGGATTFANAGNIDMGGIENTVQYITDRTIANLNFTYQNPFRVENFSSEKDKMNNVPKFLLNLTAAQKFYSKKTVGDFWVRANMHFQSKMECMQNDIVKKIMDPTAILTETQDAYTIVGMGVEWCSPFGIDLSVDAHNILDTDYIHGGQLMRGVPGMGRSFICNLKFNF